MKCIAFAVVAAWAPVSAAALVDTATKKKGSVRGSMAAAALLQEPAQVERMQDEIERMAARAKHLARSDRAAAELVEGELEDVEAALASRAGGDVALAKEISSTRGDLCAQQGFHSHEREDCESFMRKSCIPDVSNFHSSHVEQMLLPEALCRQFFLAGSGDAPASAPAAKEERDGEAGAAPAATEESSEEGEPAAEVVGGGQPAPAPVAVGAAAPAPGKAKRPWFTKAVDSLPEQGYSGDLIDHEDSETSTDDWQEEFGPNAGHRTYREICRDFPENEWCRLHMNYGGDKDDLPAGWQRSRRPEPKRLTEESYLWPSSGSQQAPGKAGAAGQGVSVLTLLLAAALLALDGLRA